MGADDDAHAPLAGAGQASWSGRRPRTGVPTLGICLGHQLVAVALGRRGRAATRAASRSGCSTWAGCPRRPDDDPWPALAGRVRGDPVEHRRRHRRCPTGRSCSPRPPTGELQVARFAPTVLGRAVAPRGRRADRCASWAAGDRDDHLERGIDQDAVLARSTRPRAELDEAWRPLADRVWSPLARGPDAEPAPTAQPRASLVRIGLRGRRALAGQLLEPARASAADPLLPILAPHRPTPTWRSPGWCGWPRRPTTGTRCWPSSPTTRAPRCGCCRCSAPAPRWPTTWSATPSTGSELTDPTLGSTRPPAYAVRAGCCAAVGADPGDAAPVATLRRRRGGRRAAGGVPPAPAAARGPRPRPRRRASTTSPPSCPTSPPATLDAALAVARARVGEAAAERPARRDRDGQVRRPRAQLRLRRRRHLRLRAGRRRRRGTSPPGSATQLAGHLMQVCSDHTAEGTHLAGRRRAAARGQGRAAGAHPGQPPRLLRALGQDLGVPGAAQGPAGGRRPRARAASTSTWSARWSGGPPSATGSSRTCRRCAAGSSTTSRPDEAERQLKLGPGGLRDVEFAVQLLQLVHGRADERLRAPTTLSALAELTEGGYVGREDGEALHDAYAFLRTARAPDPAPPAAAYPRRPRRTRPRCAGSAARMGLPHATRSRSSTRRGSTTGARCAGCTRSSSTGRCSAPSPGSPASEARLTPEAAGDRLAALGYADPEGRAAPPRGADQRGLAGPQHPAHPAAGDARVVRRRPDPDAGLFGFRRISEALGGTPWYLTTLRDEGQVAERLARLLATSRYATDLLEREPQGVADAGRRTSRPLDRRGARDRDGRHRRPPGRSRATPSAASAAIRRRELFRIAVGDLLGETEVADVGAGLSRLTDATLEATLEVAGRAVRRAARARRGADPDGDRRDGPVRRLRAVLRQRRRRAVRPRAASRAPTRRRRRRTPTPSPTSCAGCSPLPGADPALEVDADLRPEGKQGPLVRTLDSYAAYYAKWSKVWEAQALLRAEAVVGDEDAAAALHRADRPAALSRGRAHPRRRRRDPPDQGPGRRRAAAARRRPQHPPQAGSGRSGRHRVDGAAAAAAARRRGGRAADTAHPRGAGGRRRGRAARRGGREWLAHGWRTVSRVRNAMTLVRGRPGDQLPRDTREKAAVASVLGYPPGASDRAGQRLPAPHPADPRRGGPGLLGVSSA